MATDKSPTVTHGAPRLSTRLFDAGVGADSFLEYDSEANPFETISMAPWDTTLAPTEPLCLPFPDARLDHAGETDDAECPKDDDSSADARDADIHASANQGHGDITHYDQWWRCFQCRRCDRPLCAIAGGVGLLLGAFVLTTIPALAVLFVILATTHASGATVAAVTVSVYVITFAAVCLCAVQILAPRKEEPSAPASSAPIPLEGDVSIARHPEEKKEKEDREQDGSSLYDVV